MILDKDIKKEKKPSKRIFQKLLKITKN